MCKMKVNHSQLDPVIDHNTFTCTKSTLCSLACLHQYIHRWTDCFTDVKPVHTCIATLHTRQWRIIAIQPFKSLSLLLMKTDIVPMKPFRPLYNTGVLQHLAMDFYAPGVFIPAA